MAKKKNITILNGVGMPAAMYLDEFGSHLWAVFDTPAYLVGSAFQGKNWRDVDVRMILADDVYARWGFGDPRFPSHSGRWVALCMAFSELGRKMTGLPIDFQIQQQTLANQKYDGPRNALGMVDLRLQRTYHKDRDAKAFPAEELPHED